MCRNVDARIGANSTGPSPRACRRKRIPPVRATRSMSISTWVRARKISNDRHYEMKNLRISASVWIHTGLKRSSVYSATAIKARMMGSDRGTVPEPPPVWESWRTLPISTIVRISLITCSFSTACLLSRPRDLLTRKTLVPDECRYISHLTMYQSSSCSPSRLTESASIKACRISRYAVARHCFDRLSASAGITLENKI